LPWHLRGGSFWKPFGKKRLSEKTDGKKKKQKKKEVASLTEGGHWRFDPMPKKKKNPGTARRKKNTSPVGLGGQKDLDAKGTKAGHDGKRTRANRGPAGRKESRAN